MAAIRHSLEISEDLSISTLQEKKEVIVEVLKQCQKFLSSPKKIEKITLDLTILE